MAKIKKVEKRDGRIVDFDQERITDAIFSAAQSVGGNDRGLSKTLSGKVVCLLEERFPEEVPHVEDVQDAVEKILTENGHYRTTKAYILYREQRKKIRETKKLLMDIEDTMGGYLKQQDWRVNENSNIDYSFSGLLMHVGGSVIANYTLHNVYPPEVAMAHEDGALHIHDLSMGITGYCAGWSIQQLLLEGFNGVPGKVESAPPKHMDTVLGQMINFLGTLQNEWAGAMAFSSFDTYLAPYVRNDELDYRRVKQRIQQFVFNLNVASRWGGQTPFTNLTLDWTVPEDKANEAVLLGGRMQENTYDDYQDEMDMVNKAFLEVMYEGDNKGRVFTFPIPTYNITHDFDWNSKNADYLFETTAKYGLPYFQNFINSDLNPSDVRSMCCRLQMDMRELRNKTGGLFGSGESTGSVGVVTLNLPRIGYMAKNEYEFFAKLGSLMDLAKESLEVKRQAVSSNIENGLLPYTKRYLGNLDHHFSTIGLVGMNEALRNFMGVSIVSEGGRNFALKVLDFMRKKLKEYQEETGNIYNLEATPAEGTSYRLAKIDKEKFPDIVTAGVEEPYYTNSTQLPVDYTDDIFEGLELQEELQRKYTGGTVFHGFVGERITSGESTRKLVRRIAHNFRIPYFTVSPTFSVCPEHGYISGEEPTCPECNKETEVYSRVVGYLRPVKNWNKGKKEEFKERKEFDETKAFDEKNLDYTVKAAT
ncbi:MAG: ribonucleoside triphosphate reductase [Euryarchaeota archaeon]|nr:ribonucleoside triphosphate reductase [Euryarchaeota archaeon]